MSGSAGLEQAPRLLRIASPLGGDALVLRRLSVVEAISRPFTIEAEVVAERADIAPGELVGKAVTCTVARPARPPRHFHGIVRAFGRTGDLGRGLTQYRLEAVPRLWQLSRTADCRVFQAKPVKEIVQTVVDEASAAPLRFGAAVPAAPRPYCVQFNETDLDFVQRLLDETGCGYFFQHAAGDHTMVVAGANADFPLVPGEPLVMRPEGDTVDSVMDWRPLNSLRPGRVESLDFDQLKPGTLLKKEANTVLAGGGGAGFEVFLWPGGQTVRPDADPAKLAMEGAEAQAEAVAAAVLDPGVFAGGRVRIKPSLEGGARTWLITEARHEAYDETHLASGGTAGYAATLVLIPADRVWRNPEPRPRPVMAGLQSALVTGPSGEEIHTDEYGRVKIRFPWDRAGKRDDGSSCWARVLQPFGGAWGGTWFLPRVGDEVMVAFVDGDPDRPIVVGSVYNAEGKPPFALPGNKTQSGVKTRSSKAGGSDNANILRFEDKKGSEEVHLQAEKDLDLLVKNDKTEEVRHDRTETVKNDHTETITNNRTATIKQGNESLTLDMGNMSTKLKMGNQETKLDLGKITEEAMQSIELKVGQSSVKIDQMGVTIKGMTIKVEGTLMVDIKGLMVQEKADAIMMLNGSLVMIN